MAHFATETRPETSRFLDKRNSCVLSSNASRMTDFANGRSVPYRFVQHEYLQPDKFPCARIFAFCEIGKSDIAIYREKLRDRSY